MEDPGKEKRDQGGSRRSGAEPTADLYGAAVAIGVAPLMIGSGPTWAQLVSSTVTFVAALVFVATRRFHVRRIPFAAAALVGVAVTAFQLLPLPRVLVGLLSPEAATLRAEAAGGAPSILQPLTLDVPATVLALVRALGCLGLLMVVGTGARRLSRARPVVLTLAFVGAAVALIHIVQRLTGATRILGVYAIRDLPGSGFFGTFVNGNQASSLLALSGLVAAGLALETFGVLRVAAAASSVLSLGVLVTAGSRAGLIGLGAGILVFGTMMLARRLGALRAAALSLALVVAAAGVTLFASDAIRSRFTTSTLDHTGEQKIRGWKDTAKLIAAYPWTGVGRGAFEAPATAFRSDTEGVRLAFPENILLQLASEWGLPVTVALLLMVGFSSRRVIPSVPRLEPAVKGAACGLVAVLLHELADFGLELPGVAFPAAAAMGLVVARTERKIDPRSEASRRYGIPSVVMVLGVWAVALAAGLWAMPRTLLADGERIRAAVVARAPDAAAQAAAAVARHPADYYLELLSANAAMITNAPQAGRHLGRAQRLNPTDANVHLVTARWLTRNGRRSQAALEYRLARERGVGLPLEDLWNAVGSAHFAQAFPQKPENLLDAAHYLLRKGHLDQAREVSARAVQTGQSGEPALTRRLDLAVQSASRPFVLEAAAGLLAAATRPESYVAAAAALSPLDPVAADQALARGLLAHPHDSLLVVAGARLRLERSDLTGAATLLNQASSETLTIKHRIQMEELRAAIAEKRGDTVSAAVFHARARSLARLVANEPTR